MQRRTIMLLLLLALPQSAWGQGDCFPPKDSHEAQVFAALSVPLAFSLVEAPAPIVPGAVRIGLEVTYLPGID
jgi:hypothetical protein